MAPERGRSRGSRAVRHRELADRAAQEDAGEPWPRARAMGPPDRALVRHARLPRAERQPPSRPGDLSARMSKSFLRKSLAGFHPYVPGEQPPDGEGWVKLNTNESALPPSPKVIAAIRAATDAPLRLYPTPPAAPARQSTATHFGPPPAQITSGNGAAELIEMSLRAFVGAGD